MKVYDDIHNAYLGILEDIWKNPEYKCSPRGQEIRETLEYQFRILNPVAESIKTRDLERNKTIADYTRKEFQLYNSCTNKVNDFAKASTFWNKIANPDGTINSAYGYLIWSNKSCGNPNYEFEETAVSTLVPATHIVPIMRTPWEWCLESLKADKDTRQAILRFSLPEHQWMGNKDQTCTLHGNFFIRDDKLNLSISMRSNDVVLGLVYDLSWFISLMDRMIDELKPTYPQLRKGYYTHISHSMHIYDRDKKKVKKMLGIKDDSEAENS